MGTREAKKWWASFTNQFNVVVGVLVTSLPEIAEQLPALEPYLPADLYRWAFLAVVVANPIIRTFKTTGPVALK